MARSTDAQLGRASVAFCEALRLATRGELDARNIEYALRCLINELDKDGPIVQSKAFLAAVLQQPEESVAEDAQLALKLLKESNLSRREERVLRLRFGMEDRDCWSLDRLAAKYVVTRERVRNIEGQILKTVRAHPDIV